MLLRKRDGGLLNEKDWLELFSGFESGEVPDYQLAALLMAIYFRGLNLEETIDLTRAMVKSGDVLDLTAVPGFKVDKHSTGGVGDKTTLVLAPLLAAYGLPVVKLAGRALGHTGGTLDKLQSIPGVRVDLSEEEIVEQAKAIGLVVAGQSERLVPADRKLYALRDVTGTVESLPLIAASVMSKKVAGGADGIVIDVKMGSGGFCPTLETAEKLAEFMVAIGKELDRKLVVRISRMEQPLGQAVGNTLEMAEAIRTLQNEGPDDLKQLVLTLAGDLCLMAEPEKPREQVTAELEELLRNGSALQKLEELVAYQGGDPEMVRNPEKLPRAKVKLAVTLMEDGWLQHLDAAAVGRVAMRLGAGRKVKEDVIDPTVGVILWRKAGDEIHRGEPVATIHAASLEQAMQAKQELEQLFRLGPRPIGQEKTPLVDERIWRSF